MYGKKYPFVIKKYNDDRYKIVVFKSEMYKLSKQKEDVWEDVDPAILEKLGIPLPREKWLGDVIEQRWASNICRAKGRIAEIGYCNDWELFCTFTLDQKKYDRDNLPKFSKDLSQFIRDYRKKHGISLQYVFVPELHENGSWHMHGLIKGLPLEHLRLFTLEETIPYYIRNKLLCNQKIYDWSAYRKKFGYTVIEPLRTKDAAVSYLFKYIGKGWDNTALEKGKRLYYPSWGLNRAEKQKESYFTEFEFIRQKGDFYESDFVFTAWLDSDEAQKFLE